MELSISNKAKKQLKKLFTSDKKVYFNIKEAIIKLENNDTIELDIKELRGNLKPNKRVRVQNYRIIFKEENEHTYVLSIAHRQGVYND